MKNFLLALKTPASIDAWETLNRSLTSGTAANVVQTELILELVSCWAWFFFALFLLETGRDFDDLQIQIV